MGLLESVRRRVTVARLSPLGRQVVGAGLTYLRPEKLARMEAAMRETATVPGDVLEFGVALGGSGIMLANHALQTARRIYGFDVFGMIPAPTSEKDDQKSKDRYAVIESGGSTGIAGGEYYGYRDDLLADVTASFEYFGIPVDGDKVSLIKGLFQDTWASAAIAAASLVHLDCDWYDPVKFCLESVADKVSPRGMIIIDDYHDYGGCRTAVDEFLGQRGDFAFEAGPNPILRRR